MSQADAILRVRIQSIQTGVSRLPPSDRKDMISQPLADDFNKALEEARGLVSEELAQALPEPISSSSGFGELGVADATYVDLDVFCERILGLLDIAKE